MFPTFCWLSFVGLMTVRNYFWIFREKWLDFEDEAITAVFILLRTTVFIALLDRWASYRAIRTKNTTITKLWT
jgi:hypothetical protein